MKNFGGLGILKLYSNSIYRMLSNIYPGFNWEPWRFKRLPKSASTDPGVITKVIAYIEGKTNIKNDEDWYRVSKPQLRKLGASILLEKNGGLVNCLRRHRPGFDWDPSKFL